MKLPPLPGWSGWLFGLAAIGTAVAMSRSASAATPKGTDVPIPPYDGAPLPTIQLGSKGDAVLLLQAALGLAQTGSFDNATLQTVKAYQSAHSLQPDGVVGPQTWKSLGYAGKAKPLPSGKTPIPKHSTPEALPDVPHTDSAQSGRSWAKKLPVSAQLAEAQAQMLAAVDARFFLAPAMVPVTYTKDGHSVTIWGWADALAIGYEDPVRINAWHSTAQRIADRLGLMLPTTRMADAAWAQSANLTDNLMSAPLPVLTTPADNHMADRDRMVKESDMIENARHKAGLSEQDLGRDNGKDWVNTERLVGAPMPKHSSIGGGGGSTPAGANFGWHGGGSKSPGGLAVFQSVGLAHDMNYTDYSQLVTLYSRDAEVDGVRGSIAGWLSNPETAYLLSDEVTRGQVAQIWRHPAVPEGG